MPRYYSATDWKTAGIVSLVSLGFYWGTLAPSITMEYSGQLVVAADHLGVARPPGYPIWHLLAKAFTTVFSFVEYKGQPNPAWAVNFLSAVFGALACGAMALLVSRETKQLFKTRPEDDNTYTSSVCAVSAFSAALLFSFSPVLWSQAVIAETHTMAAFYVVAYLAVLLRWVNTGHQKGVYTVSFLLGLSLSISPLFLLLTPVALAAACRVSRKLAGQLATASAGFYLFIFASFAYAPGSRLLAAILLGLTLLTAVTLLCIRQSRSTGIMVVLMLLGLLPYIYLPLAASHNPPMNMGYACSWEGFWHVLSRGQYERIVLLNPFTHADLFSDQAAWYVRLAASQFTRPILVLSVLPVLALPFLRHAARRAILLLVLTTFLFSIVALTGVNPRLDVQTTFIARVLFIPSFAGLAILIGYGLTLLMDLAGERRAWRQRTVDSTAL